MALPSGYSKIDYIEATGTQYINTYFTPDGNSRIVMDFESAAVSSTVALFGARTASNENVFGMWLDPGKAHPQYGSVSYATKPIAITNTVRQTYELNKGVATVGGTSVTFDNLSFSAGQPLTLFGMNSGGSVDGRRASGKLYSCKIYDNGTLVRDFVPCKADGGELGLFDLVESVFYGNSGTGTLTTGSKHKTLIGGTGYEIKSGRVLIGGTGYDIKKGRTLIDGTGYDVSFTTALEELPPGTLVKLNENGSPVEFYVAKHDYETRLNGSGRTLLVRKDAATKMAFDSLYFQFIHSNGSQAYRWLNNTFLSRFDSLVKAAIGTTKFKYITAIPDTSAVDDTVIDGECAIFLLAISEVGGVSNQYTEAEGGLLPIASILKQLSGWSRSASSGGRLIGYPLNSTGMSYTGSIELNLYPCFTFPSTALVDDDLNIITS